MTQRNLIHAALAKAAHVGHRFKGTPSIDSEGTDMASLWAVALLALSRRAVLAHTGVGWRAILTKLTCLYACARIGGR